MVTKRTTRRMARLATDSRTVKEAVQRLKERYAMGKRIRAELTFANGTMTLNEQAEKQNTNRVYIAEMCRFADPQRGFTPDELRQFCRWAVDYGRPVGFALVIRLMTVANRAERMRFTESVLRKGLSLREVNACLMERFGRRGLGGRHPRAIGDPAKLLLGLERLTNTWCRMYDFLHADSETSWLDLPPTLQNILVNVALSMKELRGFVMSEMQSTDRPRCGRR